MRAVFSIFISNLLLLPVFALAKGPVMNKQMELKVQIQNLNKAIIAKDSNKLVLMLNEDLTYGHSNGLMQTREELIHSLLSGEQDYKTIEPSDMNVRVYDNSGIAIMKLHVIMNYEGKPLELNMGATLAWIYKSGKWKLVARQSVKL